MAKALHGIDYLTKPGKYPPAAVCVAFGDETFLKRLTLTELRRQVLGEGGSDFSLTTFDGPAADLRSVMDEVATVAMFGGRRRMVVVDDADDFVSRHRAVLEDYVTRPRGSGVLVLVVKKWAANTRLFKTVAEHGLQIECKTPPPARLLKWLIAWAKSHHGATLSPDAAEMLVDMAGVEMGLLDQQLAKLAVSVDKDSAGEPQAIDAGLVKDLVGGWRAKTAWDMIDAVAEGNAQEALRQLDRLILAGEHPISLLGQMSSTLRRFAAATRIVQQNERAGRRSSLRNVIVEAGFKPFVADKAEFQLKKIGRERGSQLYRSLLDADIALKGVSSSPPKARLVLEQLIVRLSDAAAHRPVASAR